MKNICLKFAAFPSVHVDEKSSIENLRVFPYKSFLTHWKCDNMKPTPQKFSPYSASLHKLHSKQNRTFFSILTTPVTLSFSISPLIIQILSLEVKQLSCRSHSQKVPNLLVLMRTNTSCADNFPRKCWRILMKV